MHSIIHAAWFKYWLWLRLCHLLWQDPGMLLDRSQNIDKSYLGCECVAVVDVRVAMRTIPAVNWYVTHTATLCRLCQHETWQRSIPCHQTGHCRLCQHETWQRSIPCHQTGHCRLCQHETWQRSIPCHQTGQHHSSDWRPKSAVMTTSIQHHFQTA